MASPASVGAIVGHGSTVKVHYTGSFKDGTVFDSSSGKDPFEFTVGKNMVVTGFENNLLHLQVGEEKEFDIAPNEAYGEKQQDLIKTFPKNKFPQQANLQEGRVLSFTNPDGQTFMAKIDKISNDTVVLDFNHLLAGKTLHFKVKVISIEGTH